MNELSGVIKRYKKMYQQAEVKTKDAFEHELDGVNWSIKLASNEDINKGMDWLGKTDPNGNIRKPPHGGWDWIKLNTTYIKYPQKFILSIKNNGELCGLAGGGISKGKHVTKIHYIESAPYDTPLSGYILDITMTYAVAIAELSSSNYVAIYEPNSKVKELALNEFGFQQHRNLFGTSPHLDPVYLDMLALK